MIIKTYTNCKKKKKKNNNNNKKKVSEQLKIQPEQSNIKQ